MIDFRYHAMSLAAVFVALAVGLLLGVTIGDTQLLSNFRGGLERSLQSDVDHARRQNSDLKDQIQHKDDFIQTVYPQLVAHHMDGRRVALIGSAGATRDVLKPLDGAVAPAGGNIVYAAELTQKPRYAELATALGVSGLAATDDQFTPVQAVRLGEAVGKRIARGRDRLLLRRFAFSRLSGNLGRGRLFAFARRAPAAIDSADGARQDAFERGVVSGLESRAERVVGIESSATSPSNVKWFNSLGMSTVDDIEQYAGHYAFVMILAGAKGDYGYKDSADAVIPPVAP